MTIDFFKKKFLLTFILSVAGLSVASADGATQGIFVTYDGAKTSYKLEEVPTIKYNLVNGVQYAALYLEDSREPVLNVELIEGNVLTVVIGEFLTTGIDNIASEKAVITEKNGRKLIQGGKLIIVGKDGKLYDTAGKLL